MATLAKYVIHILGSYRKDLQYDYILYTLDQIPRLTCTKLLPEFDRQFGSLLINCGTYLK